MTELQQTEFDILKQLDSVCKKLDISYFLVCGSALGAVKYQGFIPWDDDIDVAMYRKDYEVFVREAQRLLPEHLFIQNYRTEPSFPQIYSKLRNSETTYIETSAAAISMNHGVFIDIFPLDGYPEKKWQKIYLECFKRLYANMLLCAYDIPRKGPSCILHPLYRFFGIHRHTAWIAGKYEKLISAFPTENSKLICNHGNWQGHLEYAPRWHYGKGAETFFEGLSVRVPEHYPEYLYQKYGDYRQDPPESEQEGHHYCKVCNCSRPYTFYIGKAGGL